MFLVHLVLLSNGLHRKVYDTLRHKVKAVDPAYGLSPDEADKLWKTYRTIALASRLSLPRYAAVSAALQGLGRARGGVAATDSAAKIRLGV
jgi:hypothetical protein